MRKANPKSSYTEFHKGGTLRQAQGPQRAQRNAGEVTLCVTLGSYLKIGYYVVSVHEGTERDGRAGGTDTLAEGQHAQALITVHDGAP